MPALILLLLMLTVAPAAAKPRYTYACTINSWPIVEEVMCGGKEWRQAKRRDRFRFLERN